MRGTARNNLKTNNHLSMHIRSPIANTGHNLGIPDPPHTSHIRFLILMNKHLKFQMIKHIIGVLYVNPSRVFCPPQHKTLFLSISYRSQIVESQVNLIHLIIPLLQQLKIIS
ncbi:hypothetical protein ES319_D05G012700v1 [Gossypium barbadense]|uniref:Uncharacterized protein n=1 Tax=Gossypium barbadense TaxID=3634 RepID=A0A5J5RB78_GOSBA|nr:hypothetical protein ES319_D05G012700v1 [Gossypium barbadense]